MRFAMKPLCLPIVCSLAALLGCGSSEPTSIEEDVAQAEDELGLSLINGGSYSLHLVPTLRFNSIRPGSDADAGRERFGLAADMETIDTTLGLFEGPSQVFEGVVVSNGRVCATCHRGQSVSLGMPRPPLSDHIAPDDPIFTGLHADAQQDPDGESNLEDHALFKYRPNRFNLARSQDDPFRKVFFWRKSPALVNAVFSRGFLLDGRARLMFETARGAVFSHTQESDKRFDDLFQHSDNRNLEAFIFSQLSDPDLGALLDSDHPNHAYLGTHPFATVPVTTLAQWRGRNVFIRDCMSCHNTPNVFNNIWNVQAIGSDLDRPPQFPAFGPNIGRAFNIGVSERNRHNLRFSVPVGGGQFEPVVLPLANEDGSVNMHTVTFDIGLAATTGKSEDIGRFKVPQLRNIKNLGPYFHDNSADTLEEVIAYFNSNHYNNSKDGKLHRIHQSPQEKSDLLAFLNIL